MFGAGAETVTWSGLRRLRRLERKVGRCAQPPPLLPAYAVCGSGGRNFPRDDASLQNWSTRPVNESPAPQQQVRASECERPFTSRLPMPDRSSQDRRLRLAAPTGIPAFACPTATATPRRSSLVAPLVPHSQHCCLHSIASPSASWILPPFQTSIWSCLTSPAK